MSVFRRLMLGIAALATVAGCTGGQPSRTADAVVVRLDLDQLRGSASANAFGLALVEGATAANVELREIVQGIVTAARSYSCRAGWSRSGFSFFVSLGSVPGGRGVVIAVPGDGYTTVTYVREGTSAAPPDVPKLSFCHFDVATGRFYDPSDARTIPHALVHRLAVELQRIRPADLRELVARVHQPRACVVGRAAGNLSSTILQLSSLGRSPRSWAEVRLTSRRAGIVAGKGEPPRADGHLAPPVLPCAVSLRSTGATRAASRALP